MQSVFTTNIRSRIVVKSNERIYNVQELRFPWHAYRQQMGKVKYTAIQNNIFFLSGKQWVHCDLNEICKVQVRI